MIHANGITNFSNLGLVRNVEFTCDDTVVYKYDSVHGIHFPTVRQVHHRNVHFAKRHCLQPLGSVVE